MSRTSARATDKASARSHVFCVEEMAPPWEKSEGRTPRLYLYTGNGQSSLETLKGALATWLSRSWALPC